MQTDLPLNRAVEEILRRDRAVVLAGLVSITFLAWLYLLLQVSSMSVMPVTPANEPTAGMDMAMPGMDMGAAAPQQDEPVPAPPTGWTAADFILTFLMWSVMMVAMMTPSAAPMILLYARVVRKKGGSGLPYAPTAVFFCGYLVIWFTFSAGATVLQWGLANSALLSPMLVSLSPLLTALLLVAAGLYQFAPTKQACLRQCRSPVEWLSRHWRAGVSGAFRMGLEHGRICLGCCWVIMLLLFAGGVMNLLWVAAIAALVLLEKVAPAGRRIGRAGGVILIGAGLVALVVG
ncbi:MAG: DUF2182 domain-containing protein [Caldilineaceae bacterium]